MRHTLRETWSGLRRNGSMTLAVIVTMWVSLTLFGFGLLVTMQVDRAKDDWYGKIEIGVFMCVKASGGDNCDPGADATQAQKDAIEATLKENPEVAEVYYESKAQAYEEFKKVYANNPILESMTEDMMQDSYRVKLKNPEEYQGVVSAVSGLKGVQAVRDLHTVLDRVFAWLNMARWAAVGTSALLLLAAALQIPTVSLFGPTSPGKWAPQGPQHVALRKVDQCPHCFPWHPRATCAERGRCLKLITVPDVVQAMERVLAADRRPAAGVNP